MVIRNQLLTVTMRILFFSVWRTLPSPINPLIKKIWHADYILSVSARPGASYQDNLIKCYHDALSGKFSSLIKILSSADVTVRQLFSASHFICSRMFQVKVSQVPDND